MTLDLLNQMHEAKSNDCLNPFTFSKVLDYTNLMFCKQVIQGKITTEAMEMYLTTSPENDAMFAYNHQGLKDVNDKLKINMEKIKNNIITDHSYVAAKTK